MENGGKMKMGSGPISCGSHGARPFERFFEISERCTVPVRKDFKVESLYLDTISAGDNPVGKKHKASSSTATIPPMRDI